LGATAAYFASMAEDLPFRAVAVDPPGLGSSAPLEPRSHARLVELAHAVIERCECRAIVGHSLGAYVAVGVAAAPPAGLQTAVLIDGGYMEATEMAAVGMPVTEGRAHLVEWLAANAPRFPSWDSALHELAGMIGCDESAAFSAYVHEVFAEIDGEIAERATPERAADLLLATFDHEARVLAEKLAVPTLLVASGRPAERRVLRERGWQAFAARSSLVTLHVAEDWGHNPIFQEPEAFASLLGDWINETCGTVPVRPTSGWMDR
jgi:pimeloyl-ACP methyl ester carboxylesterase